MKIAIIAPTEIPARRANTMQVMKMAQALVAAGHKTHLAVPSYAPTNAPKPSWSNLAHHYGLQEQFPIEWLPAKRRMRRYDFSLRAILWAKRLKADLLYTRLPQTAATAAQMGIKTIYEIHDMPQGNFGPRLMHAFLNGRGASRLVVITHALAADLAQRFNAPTQPPFTIIAPDGVDIGRYKNLPSPTQARLKLQQQARLEQKFFEAPFIAGYTGHLYPGRGTGLLLSLAERLPEITFLLAGGEPNDILALQKQLAAKTLRNICLAGFVPNAELPLYQAACDVLLMPYQQRVAASSGGDIARYLSPMKLFEYLACQRAILSSDLPVLREVLNSDNAILLPPDDNDAWVNALRKAKDEPETRNRLAKQAQQDAQNYTWGSRAKRILEGIVI